MMIKLIKTLLLLWGLIQIGISFYFYGKWDTQFKYNFADLPRVATKTEYFFVILTLLTGILIVFYSFCRHVKNE